MLAQAQYSPLDLGLALNIGMSIYMASAEIVERLVGLRADVDFQIDMRRDLNYFGRLVFFFSTLKHQLGRSSALVSHPWCTTLMAELRPNAADGCLAMRTA